MLMIMDGYVNCVVNKCEFDRRTYIDDNDDEELEDLRCNFDRNTIDFEC
jgi:hypothetical protein